MRRRIRHPPRRTRRTQAAAFAAERDEQLVVAGRTANPREAMRQDPAAQERLELAVDMTGQSVSFRVDLAHVPQHRLAVRSHQLVEHRALGRPTLIALR
jgi:hypothetical protein